MYMAGRVCGTISPIDIRRRQSACAKMDVLRHSICSMTAQHTLPRGPGLSSIGGNMIGLPSHFGSIKVNADQLVSTGFRPLSTRALEHVNPVDTSWSAFNY